MIQWFLNDPGLVISLLYTFNILFIGCVIVLENREPERSHSWLLVIFAFPVLGFILYLFFGHHWHRRSQREQLDRIQISTAWHNLAQTSLQPHQTMDDGERHLRTLATSACGFSPTSGNEIRVLTDAHEKYPRLFDALRKATQSIELEYYIFRDDRVGREVIDILKERASQGIRVRFLIDGYGSFGFGRKHFQSMRRSGIDARYFAPLITFFYFFKLNYRDHRKLVIIDGVRAFTGGINIGIEYLGEGTRGPWRDTSIELQGPCVTQLTTLFDEAWSRTTGSRMPQRPSANPHPVTNEGIINIISSGPDAQWSAIKRLYIEMIHMAKTNIRIQTPYFIPNESIMEALVNASLRGVNVELMIPKHADHPIFRWVAMTYIKDLLVSGCRVFLYQAGFLHQKILIIDDRIATTGTCNIDIRSIELDFEVNVLFSDRCTVERLLEDYHQDFSKTTELTAECVITRPFFIRMRDSFARLIGPLL